MPKPDNTEELRKKLRALPRTKNTDPRYPIDAYEDDLVALIEAELTEMLDRLEAKNLAGMFIDPDKSAGVLVAEHRIGVQAAIETERSNLTRKEDHE